MPGLNKTGPTGAGSRTGRGLGQCRAASGAQGFSWAGLFRGIGRGGTPMGGGRGRRFGGRGTWFLFGRADSESPCEEAETLKAGSAAAGEMKRRKPR